VGISFRTIQWNEMIENLAPERRISIAQRLKPPNQKHALASGFAASKSLVSGR